MKISNAPYAVLFLCFLIHPRHNTASIISSSSSKITKKIPPVRHTLNRSFTERIVFVFSILFSHLHEKSIKNPLLVGALSNASSRNYFFSFLLKFNAVIRQVIFHCLRQKSLKKSHPYGTPSTVHSRNRSWFVLCYAILLPHLHEKSIIKMSFDNAPALWYHFAMEIL